MDKVAPTSYVGERNMPQITVKESACLLTYTHIICLEGFDFFFLI